MNGYVPARIKYVSRSPREVFDYHEVEFTKTPFKVKVTEAFPVDAENPRTLQSAIRWASLKHPKIDEFPNTPIETLRIFNLEHRGNGGRAWKVLIHEKYYVDLREDVLLDALKYGKGAQESCLSGPFVWAVVESNMKLVRVGSLLHEAILAAGERRKVEALDASALVVGGIYKTLKGEEFIYFGQADTESYTCTNKDGSYQYTNRGTFRPVFEKTEIRNRQLWARHQHEGFAKMAGCPGYYFSFVKEKKIIEQSGVFPFPGDFLGAVQEATVYQINRYLREARKTDNERMIDLADFAQTAFLRAPGEPAPEVPSLQKFMEFVGV